MTLADKFRERFGPQFKEGEPLARHVNIRIGGPAKWFVEARTTQDVIDAVTMAKDFAADFFILGGGSNTLVSDEGFVGLVIKIANRAMRIEGNILYAEAGVISAAAARASAMAGLRGFEWAISLPGTIGGGVRGNAGCFGGEMKDNVTSVRVLRNGEIVTLTADELHWGYRHSVFKEPGNDDVILDVVVTLKEGSREDALRILDENLSGRKSSQPLGASSAGCMFKNFTWENDEDVAKLCEAFHVPEAFLEAKKIPAGWMVDRLGLKGMRVGDAEVSLQHGNFLLNKGKATAKEITELVERIKKRAKDTAGIALEEEVIHVGW